MEHSDISASLSTELDPEDDEHDTKEGVLLRYFLQEWTLVKSIIDRIVLNNGATDPSDANRIRSIIDKYQEQGQLLEPYLESVVNPLMSLVQSRSKQLNTGMDVLDFIKPICIIIYSLVTTCGYKSAIRFFPHQVSDLEIAVALLEKCHNTNSLTSLRQESTGEMETQCVTLLWLYILVLIPFDISSVDTSIANSNQLGASHPSPLVHKILEISKEHLSSAGPMRRFSGLVLSRLITRPDMPTVFTRFIEWTLEFSLSYTEDCVNQFRLLGIVEALSSIFKVGSSKILLEVVAKVWTSISHLMKSTLAARNPLLRKYIIKLSQRIGLICLPHRCMQWRYMARTSSLRQDVLLNATDRSDHGNNAHVVHVNDMAEEFCEEDIMDVPEIMEEIIELILSGLKDSGTIVRWSAAKGIGRITARLTPSMAEDVLTSILELFSPGEGDGSWHGGCLALAEFARRGLLLPVNFSKVVPLIIKALHYDIRRGPHSIGSHVRDAAAYVCWAFGRAYNYSDMKGTIEQLAPHLLTVACYDREVNCRRAASAAFQENIGRQGHFSHGIDIVSSADYFSLASRANSYLNIAVSIAQFKEYLCPFVEELLNSKLSHWDRSLRELAAQALSALAKYDPDYFAGIVLERLIPLTLSGDLCTRHGATLAVGELVLMLHKCNFHFPVENQRRIAGIVPAIEKARLYRGKGGEIMRSAVSRFIDCISCSEIYLCVNTRKVLLDTLTDNMKHPNVQIQCAAVDALRQFVQTYIMSLDDEIPNMISKYLEFLDDPNVAARRGAAMALGILPYKFLCTRWKDIMRRLCSSCLLQDKPDDWDVETRVNSVRALVSVCETLTGASTNQSSEEYSIYYFIKNHVIRTLFEALDDYAVDNRGDVGSWVRDAAMDALERCTYILCKHDFCSSIKGPVLKHSYVPSENDTIAFNQFSPLFDENIATNLIKGIAKQAVEKIDKIRGKAARTLQRIIHHPKHLVPYIPHRTDLEGIISPDTYLIWEDPTVSYPCFVQLLQFSCYSRSVLSGYVISVGGLQESLCKTLIDALLGYIEDSEGDKSQSNYRGCMLCSDLLWLLQNYQKNNRIILPTMKTIEVLFSRKFFFNMEDHALEFFDGLLDSMEIELKGSKDFTKLTRGISILGYLASLMKPMSRRAVSRLLFFLGHQYPKIRKAAADQVYLVIMQNTSLMAEDKAERSLEILAETSWDGSLDEAKERRLELSQLAGFDDATIIPVSVKETGRLGKQTRKDASDENLSYSSLVDFSGF